jgi:NADP-dependent aldehyde dehydrogenase
MEPTGRTLLAGAWTEGEGPTFHGVDATTGMPLQPPFRESTRAQVGLALEAAREAAGVFAATTGADRADFLRAIAVELQTLGDALLERATVETALPLGRLSGERSRTVGQLRLFADLVEEGSWVDARVDPGDPGRTPTPRPDVRRMLVAVGPVAVFGASNFPFAFSVPGGDTTSALAAGCPVVCKGHPAHPGTSELAAEAVRSAAASTGMPAGVFSMVQGASNEVGIALVTHPHTRAVGFTGSLRGGRALFDAAAARPDPIPVYAEMGSVNPVFLLPSAVESGGEALARGLAASIALGVGQFCTNPGVIVAMRSPALDRLRDTLAAALAAVEPAPMLHAGIAAAFAHGTTRAVGLGARPCGTPPTEPTAEGRARPALLSVDGRAFVDEPALREEVFGPVSLLVEVDDAREMIRVAGAFEGQLTATLRGSDEELLRNAELVDLLRDRVGRLVFNGFPTGVEVGHAMEHGGPYPASTDAGSTSVGTAAILRFVRPVCYQDFPDAVLPRELRRRNETGIWRRVDGMLTREDA